MASFVPDARVYTPLRESLGAATEQGIRWERGRMANAATHGFRLLVHGLRQRSALRVFAGLDAVQPPVAVLTGLCALIAVSSIAVPGAAISSTLAIAPLFFVGLYGLFVIEQGRREGIRASAILWAPVYIAWRCMSFVLALGGVDRLKRAGKARESSN